MLEGLFGKVNKDEVDAANAEINKVKPNTVVTPERKAQVVNVAGNVTSIIGTALTVIVGVGAASIAFASLVSYLGFGLITSMLILGGTGVVLQLIGNRFTTESWLPQT